MASQMASKPVSKPVSTPASKAASIQPYRHHDSRQAILQASWPASLTLRELVRQTASQQEGKQAKSPPNEQASKLTRIIPLHSK
jgi:hypothetical protein